MIKIKSHFSSILICTGLCLLMLCGCNRLMAQDTTDKAIPAKHEPIKYTFESILLLDNHTVIVPNKGTLEFDIQHRFGLWNKGYEDLYGLYAPSNIRLGFEYVVINNLMVGFGFCKERLQWDGNIKYAIITQSKKGGWPVSITYFGNFAVDTRDEDNFVRDEDRIAYFNQIMIARKVTKNLSLQVAPSLSYFNNVEGYYNSEGVIKNKMNNEHFAVAFMGRFKISNTMAVLANYDQPLTEHTTNNPDPNLSFGIELSTSSHAFQIFAGNYSSILPENNNFYNQNNYKKNQYLIGFNITRMWAF